MRGARALIFPAYEDFGMAPVEMMACGRPVVAYGAGGVAETVIDGVTGVFAADQSVDSFIDALRRFERTAFDRRRIRAHAEKFSQRRFQDALRSLASDAHMYSRQIDNPTANAEPSSLARKRRSPASSCRRASPSKE
jgi:glycosyltransferase involved in cell wall biosynthesis